MTYGREPNTDTPITFRQALAKLFADDVPADVAAVSPVSVDPLEQITWRDRKLDIKLKKRVEKWARWATSGVLISSCLVMAAYIYSEWGHIDSTVVLGWLSATVVETIGIMYLITKYLFSNHEPLKK